MHGRVVEHDDAGRTEERARLLHAVEARLRIELIGQQDRHRGPAGNDAPSASGLAHAARVAVDQLARA